jgi:hypothetical protein
MPTRTIRHQRAMRQASIGTKAITHPLRPRA